MRQIFKPFGNLTDEMWAGMARSSLKLDAARGKYIFDYDPKLVSGLTPPAQTDQSLEPLWKAVKSEHVLLLRGKESDILPVRGVDLMKQSRPDLEVVEFENVGHAPCLMFEDQLTTILDWMNKHYPN